MLRKCRMLIRQLDLQAMVVVHPDDATCRVAPLRICHSALGNLQREKTHKRKIASQIVKKINCVLTFY